jgi:hypothetical protein
MAARPSMLRTGQHRPVDRKAVMSVIKRHPVITFFLLAYALSWDRGLT